MASPLSAYLVDVAKAIINRDGRHLRAALDVNNVAAKEAVFERARGRAGWEPGHDVRTALRFPGAANWQEILELHCRCLHCLNSDRAEEAYVSMEGTVLAFTKEYREDAAGWLCEPLVGLAHNMRTVALAADDAAKRRGRKSGALESAGGSLQRVFASAIGGTNPAKKAPVLDIVVTLFRIYFRLNTLRLCKNLIAAVARLDFAAFPAAARVSYQFFVGRLAIFDDRYEEAEQALGYALRHCHRRATANKARILYFLVPVKMLLGQLPSRAALQRHRLTEYADIVEAMRTGNIRLLNESLEANQWRFIRAGTYLVLEKLKQPVLRRLLKRTALLHAQAHPDRPSNQLPLQAYQRALAWQRMPLDIDEVECLVANLIYRGYVKAYISFAKKTLVLSKVAPFPHLKDVNLADLF